MYYSNEKIPAEQKELERKLLWKSKTLYKGLVLRRLLQIVSKEMVDVQSALQNKRWGWKADVHLKK